MSQVNSYSPPPLRHPVPTHPAYIPDPPSTPGSPQAYQRYSSSPGPGQQQQQQPHIQSYPTHVPAYTNPFQHSQPPIPPQYQQNMQHMQQQPTSPDFVAWGLDGATAQIGMQLGHSAVAAGQQYVEKNVGIIYLYLHSPHFFT